MKEILKFRTTGSVICPECEMELYPEGLEIFHHQRFPNWTCSRQGKRYRVDVPAKGVEIEMEVKDEN